MAFVFYFGYETPEIADQNDRHGWDLEASQAVVIATIDEQVALDWGCEVAERFLSEKYGVSWRAGEYARWVEPVASEPQAEILDRIAVGQFPDFSRW